MSNHKMRIIFENRIMANVLFEIDGRRIWYTDMNSIQRERANKLLAAQHSVQRTCAQCGADDWRDAIIPDTVEICNRGKPRKDNEMNDEQLLNCEFCGRRFLGVPEMAAFGYDDERLMYACEDCEERIREERARADEILGEDCGG